LHDETVGGDQAEMSGTGFVGFQAQALYPGVELLGRKFLLEAVQTGGPEFIHCDRIGSGRETAG